MKTCTYGKIFDKTATLYHLENERFKVAISDFGGIIKDFIIKTKNGEKDIVLGFNNAVNHFESNTYAGAIIGRVANGITGSSFTLNGKKYSLFANEPNNICNHGGKRGFDKYFYNVTCYEDAKLTLYRLSENGEENFPANLEIEVTYELKQDGLSVSINAKSDGDTYFAPTLHPYFNLSGSETSVENVLLKVNAKNYTQKDGTGLPNGNIDTTKNTLYDFSEFKELGVYDFDVNFCTESDYKATAIDKNSNLRLDVYSNLEGLQLYVPNFTESLNGKNDKKYTGRCAFCLEPQFYPNAVNVKAFTKPLIKKGEQKNYYINYFVTEV